MLALEEVSAYTNWQYNMTAHRLDGQSYARENYANYNRLEKSTATMDSAALMEGDIIILCNGQADSPAGPRPMDSMHLEGIDLTGEANSRLAQVLGSPGTSEVTDCSGILASKMLIYLFSSQHSFNR